MGGRLPGKFSLYMTGETASAMARMRTPRGSSGLAVFGLPFKAGPDQVHDVTIQHVIGVVTRGGGAVILDVLLVQHVAADLRAPLDRLLVAPGLQLFVKPGALLALPEAAAQHGHRLLAVLDLRLAVLAGHDDLVGSPAAPHEPHGGVRGVDRLPARA